MKRIFRACLNSVAADVRRRIYAPVMEETIRLLTSAATGRRIFKQSFKIVAPVLLLAVAAGVVVGQRTARDIEDQRGAPVPEWKNAEAFKKDVFTFVRIKYTASGGHTFDRWAIDAPDSDLNFSYRLQQMTSMKVDPDGKFLELTDKELFDYPFIYIVEPGRLMFKDEEVTILRNYLLNGGFLMVDDFWGKSEWANFYREIKRVFPEDKYEPQELPLEHSIFHCVFDLKEKPQIPNVNLGTASQYPGPYFGMTWERPDAKEVHYKEIKDDKGRMMVIICHNTDLGDGWEQEGANEYYFHEFSEKKAYPLGINIIFYAMTH